MYSSGKWISKIVAASSLTLILTSGASAQIVIVRQTQSLLPADEARDIFNAGQQFYDQNKFSEAEARFREVLRRFPNNVMADRADYYLIRTLSQVGKKTEAISRIDNFARQYPKSKWLSDVQEMRIQLTNQIPPRAEILLTRVGQQTPPTPPSPAPPGTFGTPVQITGPAGPQPFAIPPIPPMPPMPAFPFGPLEFQSSDPEISLQQEIMRAMFRNNADRAIEIATERLKADPADPVVLSSLNALAGSRSAQAMPMLLAIVKNSTNPKARRDAIFWMGQSRGDKDVIVDTLTGLLPSLPEEDSEAVAFTLSQIRTEKALNTLVTIARDKSKSEKVRTNSVFWIGQSRVANRVRLLEDIYKSSMDNSKIRQQAMFALSQTREPEAVKIMAGVASTDPDIEVRKQAVFWLGQNRSPDANQALEELLRKK